MKTAAGRLLATAACFLAASAGLRAGTFDLDEAPESAWPLRWSAVANFRYASTSDVASWLTGGTNKLRYGGSDTAGAGVGNRDANVFSIPQASLLLDAQTPSGPRLHVQLGLSADTESNSAATIGIQEIYASIAHRWDQGDGSARAGAFIPQISWEHPNKGWSTEYTLTPSAIGSWIGEEVRTYGAEGTWETPPAPDRLALTAGAFSGGDQVGAILLKRGWSLDDFESDLNQSLPLPGGTATTQPFRELDGRLGGYGRVNLHIDDDLVRLGGGYWNNNGNINAKSTLNQQPAPGLQVWGTQFWDAGGQLNWRRWTVLSQFIHGESASLSTPREDWESWYALAAYSLRNWMLSGRYDHFWVGGGLESGYALTSALQCDLTARDKISLEYIYLLADPNLATGRQQKDEIIQLNYRLRVGS
jgi:hypothetical protein